MVSVGVYTGERECAAAVAVNGRIVAAVNSVTARDSVHLHGTPLACVERAFAVAGMSAGDIDTIVVASDTPPSTVSSTPGLASRIPPRYRQLASAIGKARRIDVAQLHASAAQLRGIPEDTIIVGLDLLGDGLGAVFSSRQTTLRCIATIDGVRELVGAATMVADAIGDQADEPFAFLEAHYRCGADVPEPAGRDWLTRLERTSISTDAAAVAGLLDDARAGCPSPLDVPNSSHIAVHRARAALATTLLNRIGDLLGDIALDVRAETGAARIAFSGNAFRLPSLRARVASRVDVGIFAPVTERIGAALGAALLPHGAAEPVRHLALGRAFSEQEIKDELENCRLDYVYEPDFEKLCLRTSRLLSTGAIIGWFHGPAEFGHTSHGSRSILCDPSNMYSRENMNVFLLQRHAHEPLPLSITERASIAPCALATTFAYSEPPTRGDTLTSAVDRNGRCLIHMTDQHATPDLYRLLRVYEAQSGVSGLFNVPLASEGLLAETPKAGLRASFASAVDALIVGRFVIGKDHWLVRSR